MAIDIEEVGATISRIIAETSDAVRELTAREFTGEAADGRVKATITGGRELRDIWFAPRVTRELDNVTLGEAVVEAVNRAEDEAEELRRGILRMHRPFGMDPEAFLRDPTAFVPRPRDPFAAGGRS